MSDEIDDALADTSNLERLRELANRLSNVEYALAYSNAALAAIVANAGEAILAKDTNGIITAWNPAAEKLYGWASEEVIGKHVNIIVPEDRREELEGLLKTVYGGEAVKDLQTERVKKNGQRIEVLVTISPIKDLRGEIVGASAITRPGNWTQ